jgi:hypothetical protein
MVIRSIVIIALVAACSLDTAGMKNACTTQADCLDGFVCTTTGTCEMQTECTPIACEQNQCGMIDNGCGGKLECGGCALGQECGLVNPNQCGTLPPHCTNQTQDASLGETGTDCGGECSGCPTGGGCKTTDDCAAGNTCTADVCLAGTWSTVAELPTARDQLTVVLGPDGLIYAIGGKIGGSRTGLVEVYNPATNSWSTRTPMPTARYGFAAVVGNDGKIYTIGGEYFSVNDDAQSIIAEVYNPSTDSWQSLPQLPQGRYNPAAAVALDGTIYVTGGFSGTLYQTHSSTIKLTPGGTSWVAVTPAMTSPRSQHAMARTSDGKLYAIAGYNGSTDLKSFEYMMPGTPGWNTLPPLAYARKLLATVVKDDKIYAIGGFVAGIAAIHPSIEVYSPATNSWTRAPDMPAGRYGHGAVTLPDGRIFVIGGRRAVIPPTTTNQSEQTKIVEVLTP